MRIDQAFETFEEWLSWCSEHAFVGSADFAKTLSERIVRSGFTEPLTGRRAQPGEIDLSVADLREGLSAFGISSRLRGILMMIEEKLQGQDDYSVRIFATEAVTTFALLMRGRYPRFLGSEFGVDEAARAALFPIPHEDMEALTFPDDSFDLVVSNEVLEHVVDIDQALREVARVLRPGGCLVASHPFLAMSIEGDVRARMVDGEVEYLKEPEWHGNPIDPERGSLVFETPGWNILDRARAAGFSKASMRFIASSGHGIITENTGLFLLTAEC